MRIPLRAVVAAIAMTFGAVAIAQAQKPVQVAGSYKLNLEKSKYSPGPAPRSDTRTFIDRGGGTYIYQTEGMNAQGAPTYNSWTFKYDGLDYPSGYNAMTREKGATAYQVIDPYTVQVIQKVNGKPTAIKNVRTISKDRKTMTYTTTGTNAQGQAVNNVAVFEKVQGAPSTR